MSEPYLLATLEATGPLIVDDDESPAGARFLATFPAVARFIASTYAPEASFGRYRVLAPHAAPG